MISLNELLVIIIIFSSAIIYFFIPDIIPIHWGVDGSIDGWGPRYVSLITPLMIVGIYYLWKVIPKVAVFKSAFRKLGDRYDHFLTVMILFFMVVQLMMIVSSFGVSVDARYFIIPSITILFMYIGRILKNVKRNYFMGIRTPWTLSSDKSWKQTHERGAKLFQVFGLLFLIILILPSEYMLLIIVIPLMSMIAYLYVYSYFVWKKDKKAIRK